MFTSDKQLIKYGELTLIKFGADSRQFATEGAKLRSSQPFRSKLWTDTVGGI